MRKLHAYPFLRQAKDDAKHYLDGKIEGITKALEDSV
jgi:hypothetical protein